MPAAARPTVSCVQAAPSVEAKALRSRHARQLAARAHEALVAGAQRRLGGEEQLELVLQRDGERVELAGRGPVPERPGVDRRQRRSAAVAGCASATASARASAASRAGAR